MSIPRLAIERPVTMFMISLVIILLGTISLSKLPVDLMPDTQIPTITVRVGYAGVGPLEIEELDHAADRAGRERRGRPRPRGLDLVGGQRQHPPQLRRGARTSAEAADDVRTRLDRVRGRLPEDADPPTVFKFDSTADADHGRRRRRRLRRGDAPRNGAERHLAAPRARRRRRRRHGERRPAPPDSRGPVAREDHGAQPLAGPRRPDAPHREPEHPARRDQRRRPHPPAAQPRASSPTSTRFATWSS